MLFKLDVAFREKDAAKALGARWNYIEKCWYYEGETLPRGLERWAVWQPDRAENVAGSQPAGFESYKTVSEVSQMIAGVYGDTPEFRTILVKGEVTNYSGQPRGGHYYFAIKDEGAVLACRLWQQNARTALQGMQLEQGKQIAVVGALEFYGKRGESALIVRQITDIGAGAASLEMERLKQKLEAEGLFRPEHKKEIPRHPKKVGILTAKGGQAIRDICQKAKERDPFVQLVLYPVIVQGQRAPESIIRGLRFMDGYGCDTLIIGRGGGGDEELAVFNDEKLARAVYQAQTPIISAVGHEGNYTLIDLVSDFRVSTPTSAAEKAIPDVMADVKRTGQLAHSIRVQMYAALQRRTLGLDRRRAELEKLSPVNRLKEQKNRLERTAEKLRHNMQKLFEGKKNHFQLLVAGLNGLSPTAKLVKGFGYISAQGRPVASVDDVHEEEEIQIRIHDGEICSRVTGITKKGMDMTIQKG